MTPEEAARAELEAEVRARVERGDGEAACRLAADNWRQWSSSGDIAGMVGMELHNLGHLEIRRGNVDAAKRHFADCHPLRDAGNPYDNAMKDLNDAALSAVAGNRDRAGELVSRAEQTLEQAGILLDPD